MKDKKIFKRWWFWAIAVVIVLGVIGSLGRTNNNAGSTAQTNNSQTNNSESTLPKLSLDDYKGKEGLIVYKDLKTKGYKVDAAFEKQTLTDINGQASDLFDPLDPNKTEDRESVDSFVVGSLTQDGDSVKLVIIKISA